jgi:hypothetical protein
LKQNPLCFDTAREHFNLLLLPISRDAIDGAAFAVNLAQIYTWAGEEEPRQ